MNIWTKALLAVALACGALTAGPAMAHGRVGIGIGFGFGGPAWYPGPYYYPAPAYYYPPPVVVQQAPVYIEQPQSSTTPPAGSAPAAAASADWYYCRESQAYYPYVKQCASPWQRVPSQPR